MSIPMIDLLPQQIDEAASMEGAEGQLLPSLIPAGLFAAMLDEQYAQGALERAQHLAEVTGDPVLILLDGQPWAIVTLDGVEGDGEALAEAVDLAEMMMLVLVNPMTIPNAEEGLVSPNAGEPMPGLAVQPAAVNPQGLQAASGQSAALEDFGSSARARAPAQGNGQFIHAADEGLELLELPQAISRTLETAPIESLGSPQRLLESGHALLARAGARPNLAANTMEPGNWAPGMALGEGVLPEIDSQSAPQQVERVTIENFGQFTVRSIRHLVGRTQETITVRLVPESLGELQVVVKFASGEMEVRLVSASPAVRAALEGQLPGLRDTFAREGLDVAKISISANTAWNAASGSQYGRNTAYEGLGTPQFSVIHADTGTDPAYPPPLAAVHEGSLNLLA